MTRVELDCAIVGGGVAGLWVANLLQQRGYSVIVVDQTGLGSGQTFASQGMIHGGIKYALSGTLSTAAHAIAGMPDRWRSCLNATGDIDLRKLEVASEYYYMFAKANTLGRLTTFFASHALRGKIKKLKPGDYPVTFQQSGFDGVVYQLQDLVLDSVALVTELARPLEGKLYQGAVDRFDGQSLFVGDLEIRPRHTLLTAGSGNGPLLHSAGIQQPAMQLRPLHQVIVQLEEPQTMFAHCISGLTRAEPRLTITSHEGGSVWYLGGQLATDGVNRSEIDQVAHAKAELEVCVPWLDWSSTQFSTFTVDRAEPEQIEGVRPDEAFVQACGYALVCWPTKLSLVPDLGDKVIAHIQTPPELPQPQLNLPAASLGKTPWSTNPC